MYVYVYVYIRVYIYIIYMDADRGCIWNVSEDKLYLFFPSKAIQNEMGEKTNLITNFSFCK